MNRLIIACATAIAGIAAAAVPAFVGLAGNSSFSHRLPVHAPASAQVVSFDGSGHARSTVTPHPVPTRTDDHGGLRTTATPTPGEDHGGSRATTTAAATPSDDHGGLRTTPAHEPGDDRSAPATASGATGSAGSTSSTNSTGDPDEHHRGRRGRG